ncbi:hypothetical protein DFH27DRAFT_138533 [Peziza echinospora]|nr:hypothetical protein DFH27DRAFT_138533 [Peziza echinospora]
MASNLTADIERLRATVTSLLALISHCQSSLSTLTSVPSRSTEVSTSTSTSTNTTTSPPPPLASPQIPPLSLLHDAASLTRAHTTKLALLITNSTPTPLSSSTAVTKLLSTVQSSVLPPLLTSLDILHTHNHGAALLHSAATPAAEIFRGLAEMVGVFTPFLNGTEDKFLKGADLKKKLEATVLPITGRVWSGCDALIALKPTGLVGVVSSRLKSSAETVSDAMAELKEYLERHSGGGAVDGDEDGDDDEDDADDDDDFGWDDDFPNTDDGDAPPQHNKPRRKRIIIPQKTQTAITATLKRFKTLTILFTAIQKRRLAASVAPLASIQTVTPDQSVVQRLGSFVDLAEEIVVLVDDVVGEYYELEGEDGDEEEGEKEPKPASLSPTETSLINKIVALATAAQPAWEGGEEDASSKLFGECIKAIQR